MAEHNYKYTIQKSGKFYHLYRSSKPDWDWELISSSSSYDTVRNYYEWIPHPFTGDLIDVETFGMGVYG